MALRGEHDHAGAHVVQHGLKVGAGAFELQHAVLDQRAGVCQLLGHGGEGAGQAPELVTRGEDGFGPQVATRDLLHAFCQQQQGPHELLAEQGGQQEGAEDREHQRQRQRADVHLAQATSPEGALLVLLVGRLHIQRVAHEVGRQHLRDEQVVPVGLQAEAAVWHPGQGDDARRCERFAALIQAVDLGHHAPAARLLAPRRGQPLGGEQARSRSARGQPDDAAFAGHRHGVGAELLAQPLQLQQRGLSGDRVGLFAQAQGGHAGLARQVLREGVQGAAPEVEPGFQCAFDAHVEPGLDAA